MTELQTGLVWQDFLVWAGVVTLVLGGGMGAIAAAYFWPTGRSRVFETATAAVPALSSTWRDRFEQGCAAHAQGRYRRAIDCFTDVISAEPTCAEAYHNLGETFANLGDDQAALRYLVKAGALYDQQGDKAGVDALLADLNTLRQQRKTAAKAVPSAQ